MPLNAKKLHPLFAAEVSGTELSPNVSAATLAEIIALMNEHAVCVYHHERPLTDEEHIDFSLRLGPVQSSTALRVTGKKGLRIPRGEIIDQSNLDEDGAIFAEGDRQLLFKRANRLWHTDLSFHPVRATYSLLSAHKLPPDGGPDTEFIDMRAVYDALPAAMKERIEPMQASHSYWHSRVMGGGPEPTEEELQSRPPALHRLVQRHPRSGRATLYLASHAQHIVGMPLEKGRALLQELMAFAAQPRFVFAHKWRLGDVVIWDNLATMHRATPFEDTRYVRDVRRTTCREAEVA
jgi:alpha-ketoglutarate-dependent 2,4-dichlorophenoxyacetate dioxygenase